MLHGANAIKSSPKLCNILMSEAIIFMAIAPPDIEGAWPASEAAAWSVAEALAAAVRLAPALADANALASESAQAQSMGNLNVMSKSVVNSTLALSSWK